MTTSDAAPARATVELHLWAETTGVLAKRLETGEDGAYEAEVDLSLAPARSDGKTYVRVVARARGWAPAADFVEVVARRDHRQDLVLESGRLAGRVVDASGRPVADLTVRAGKPGAVRNEVVDGLALERRPEDDAEGWHGEATSDADGRFEMRGLSAQPHPLFSASAAWFVTPARFAGPGPDEIEVTVVPALSVTGSVVDARTRKPVEATVFLGLTREQHGAPGTLVYEINELPSRTRDGRFSFVWPASAAHAERGSLASLRAVPESPDYGDAATPSVRIEKGETSAKHELAVERMGMGTAVVTATKPNGAPFEGALDVRLVSQVGTFGQRETTIARDADGLFRIAVPAERSWMAWIQPSRPLGESGYYAATRRVPLRVAAGEAVTVAVVFPGMGRVRVRSPREKGLSIVFEPLGAERSGSMTLDMSGIVPAEEGHVAAISEGRWRVTRKGNGEDLVREVDVRDGEEAALDLR